jgi:electron transport complex protein RnfG
MSPQLRRSLQVVAPLLVIMLVGSLLLSRAYEAASERIADNKRQLILNEIRAVFPLQYDNELLDDVIELTDENLLKTRYPVSIYRARLQGENVGVILRPLVTGGYNDLIRLAIGISVNGEITGVHVVEHHETPGLGAAIDQAETDWLMAFTGRSLQNSIEEAWNIRAEGGEFDAFSGASITPRAVVGAVQRGLKFYDIYADRLYQ